MKSTQKNLTTLQLCAMRGPIHRSSVRFDITPLPEAEFQQKVLDGVDKQAEEQKKLQKQLGEITENYDNLQKETKKAVEELTNLKNKNSGDIEGIQRSIQKVNLELSRERRLALGNPIERIANDEEKKARFNAAVRLMTNNQNGDMLKTAKNILGSVGKDLGEDTAPGSTLITPELAKDIYDTLAMYGAWNTLGVRRMGTKIQNMPVKTARAAGQWITTEGGTITNDTAKAGTSKTLQAFPIAVLLNVSLQLLQDAEFDVTADVMDDFVEAWNQVLDFTAFVGNAVGDGTDAGQTGLFNAGTVSTAASTRTTVAATKITDWMNAMMSVDPVVLARQARWWMHPFMLTRSLGIQDTTGRPMFLTILERPAANAIGSILGYPVTFVYNAPNTDAAGNKIAAFGDPQGQVVGIRQDFNFEFSDHAGWNEYERSFRGVGRAGTVNRRSTAFGILKTAAS